MLSAAHLRFGPCASDQNGFAAFTFAFVIVAIAVVVLAKEEEHLVSFHLHFVHTHMHTCVCVVVPSVSLRRVAFGRHHCSAIFFFYYIFFTVFFFIIIAFGLHDTARRDVLTSPPDASMLHVLYVRVCVGVCSVLYCYENPI